MFKNIYSSIYDDEYYMKFSFDCPYDLVVQAIINSPNNLQFISVEEGADVSLGYYGGDYSVEDFKKLITKNQIYPDSLYFHFDDVLIKLSYVKDIVTVTTKNQNFDLNEFIIEKKSEKSL